MRVNSFYKYFTIACLILILTVAIPYFIKFNGGISNETAVWGAFGDYFGGILNPIFAIINIGILIYLTHLVHKIDSNRVKKELEIQKQIAIYGLKHDALKAFNNNLSKFQLELVKSNENSELNIILHRNDFYSLIETYTYLFPSIENDKKSALTEKMRELSKIAGDRFVGGNEFDIPNKLEPKLLEFIDLKIEFIKNIQNCILE
ncbi:hypothetical protein N7U66_04815 [Lacinutrix neustonica]|uniref:Uncharacterized protein n=1 Tax=Lacinutrix neustonica TaxID=2980107 RepID=A0A9E8MZ70_9FLAO|nr:hypothetical protein [Lacinutrix neustonica]WAC02954.1 hypothetical protein N7U66_04815 [Lacinutrix neustonica]